MDYQEFVLNGLLVDNSFTTRFQQPITIPKNAILEVKWINVQMSPAPGYLAKGYSALIDLSSTVQQSTTTDVGFERKILINIPPQNQADLSVDDPGALPATVSLTYEPYQSVVHYLRNNEMSINQFTIKMTDLQTQFPPNDTLENVSVYFCIKNGHPDPRSGEKTSY